jgi:tetratricopeptide (TPR) repeat protein
MSAFTHADASAREALSLAAADLQLAQAGAAPAVRSMALAQMARCYRGLGEWPSAERCFEQALDWAQACGSLDLRVDVLCELAQTAAGQSDVLNLLAPEQPDMARAARVRARGHAFEATALAARVADSGWESTVLLRISEVLDRCGDHDDAAKLQTRALRMKSGRQATGAPDPRLLPALERLADS